MRINTNVSALNAYRNLTDTNNAVASSMQKLSSGFRINRAADDAAGLGIANRLRADIRSMTQANRNAEQANSVLQIAEGATGSVQKMLERMKELATQAASDSVDGDGRARINEEFVALRAEIQRTADTTKFQGNKLIAGEFGAQLDVANSSAMGTGKVFHDAKLSGAGAGAYTIANTGAGTLTMTNGSVTQAVTVSGNGRQSVNFSQFGITLELTADYAAGATAAANEGVISVAAGTAGGTFMISSSGSYGDHDSIELADINLTTGSDGLNLEGLDLTNIGGAETALGRIDLAMEDVNTSLGKIGALQNRIENAMSNLKTSIQNYSAAESVIRDLDMAEEMTKFSKNNILAQAGTAMLAQANQSSQGVLQLLRG